MLITNPIPAKNSTTETNSLIKIENILSNAMI